MDNDVPQEYLCPITLSIMDDPVLMPDGQTYERSAILAALEVNPISPITRQPMKIEDAIPNYALKSLIDTYQAQHMPSPGAVISNESLQKLDFFTVTTSPDPQNDQNSLVHVSVRPSFSPNRAPIALIAMIDISGSMSNNCCENIEGMEDLNLTRLQLVKHGLKTVISTLSDADQITLITFHTTASILLPATQLTAEGKTNVVKVIDSMVDRNATNIWDALKLGIDNAWGLQGKGFNVSLMLFTDGEPNRNPPMGIMPTLEEYISGRPLSFSISSFGFGYQLDSELLEGIAKVGNGVYGYCPDSTMVGTIFINYMANALCQLTSAELICKGPSIDLKQKCDLYNGSSRNFLFVLPKSTVAQTSFMLDIGGSLQESAAPVEAKKEDEINKVRDQYWRKRLLDILFNSLHNIRSTAAKSLVEINNLFEELIKENSPTKFMTALMTDLVSESANHGQVSKGFSPGFYQKWGKDYLRSFLTFHALELTGNFKDESLQFYGGAPFATFRKIANKLFSEIPPPEATPAPKIPDDPEDHAAPKKYKKASNAHSYSCNYMNQLNTRYTGCFGGDSFVVLADGSTEKVENLTKGTKLRGGAVIECLVKIDIKKDTEVQAVCLNGALFTLYHPVLWEGQWKFPVQIKKPELVEIGAWYNLVVKNAHSVKINGVEAVTLGHELKGNIVEHSYFGTEKVVNALKKRTGYDDGLVAIKESDKLIISRDSQGLISNYF